MRSAEKAGLLIGLGGLMLAVVGLNSRTAQAAPRPNDPYAPQPPATGGTTQVTYGTFQGPVRGDPTTWRAQRMLEALGYDPRGDDGRFGTDTRNALNDFERDYGLPVTSTLTASSLANLETEYARIAPPGATAGLGDAPAPRGGYRSRY